MQRVQIMDDTLPSPLRDGEEDVQHFSLQGLIPSDSMLVVNRELRTLSLIQCDRPYLVREQRFTPNELRVLLPLLEAYPYYCPHEVMLASFTSGRVTEKTIARCRQRLLEALDAGVFDQEMRPVRSVLSRARLKIRRFGIDINSIIETGYILSQKKKDR